MLYSYTNGNPSEFKDADSQYVYYLRSYVNYDCRPIDLQDLYWITICTSSFQLIQKMG